MSDPAQRPIEVLRAQATAQLRDGLFDEAVSTFSACLALETQDAASLQGRALARFQLKQWSAAIEDFRAAKSLNPGDPENWVGLGMSLAMENQIYPAIETLEGLLAAHPDYVRGHIQLGLLYLQLGLIPKGRQQLQQALAHRPTLAQRRFIEAALKEQDKLDPKRYYRPDFEALHRQRQGPGMLARLRQRIVSWGQRLRKSAGTHPLSIV